MREVKHDVKQSINQIRDEHQGESIKVYLSGRETHHQIFMNEMTVKCDE